MKQVVFICLFFYIAYVTMVTEEEAVTLGGIEKAGRNYVIIF